MTKYFEVEQRDGAARIGKLLLSPEIRTPCILSTAELGNLESPGPVVDAGSFWDVESQAELEARVKQIRKKVGSRTLIILPHQAYVPSVSSDSRDEAKTPATSGSEKVEGPTGSLLRPQGEILGSDLYIMEGAGILENNALIYAKFRAS
jgi:archaeosine synthase